MASAIHEAIMAYDVVAFRAAVNADPSAANEQYNSENAMENVPSTALGCLLSFWYHVHEQETDTVPTMTDGQISAYREMVDILMANTETDIQILDDEVEFCGLSWLNLAFILYIECMDERDQTRWVQFADYAAHVIRKYNERADYDPNELREVFGGSVLPDWFICVTMTNDHVFVSTVLDALLEHPDINPSKLYTEPAGYDPVEGGVRFTNIELMSSDYEQFRDRLARARSKRLWAKVRISRFLIWWWTNACEGQYAQGGPGFHRTSDEFCKNMKEICNKRMRIA